MEDRCCTVPDLGKECGGGAAGATGAASAAVPGGMSTEAAAAIAGATGQSTAFFGVYDGHGGSYVAEALQTIFHKVRACVRVLCDGGWCAGVRSFDSNQPPYYMYLPLHGKYSPSCRVAHCVQIFILSLQFHIISNLPPSPAPAGGVYLSACVRTCLCLCVPPVGAARAAIRGGGGCCCRLACK